MHHHWKHVMILLWIIYTNLMLLLQAMAIIKWSVIS
jgi:hypothetical protein